MLSRIAHATDFHDSDGTAFLHALALAVATRSRLDILHVAGRRDEHDWRAFPHVREPLVRWGLLEPTATPEAIGSRLGVHVSKVEIRHPEPLEGLSEFLLGHRPDLVVLASHARHGVSLWLKGSFAGSVAQRTHLPTLLIGPGARGFVDPATGAIRLGRVLMPVLPSPSPAAALARVLDLFAPAGLSERTLGLITVGEAMPDVAGPTLMQPVTRLPGDDPVAAILDAAARNAADLIVLPTLGRHGLLDALRGSTTSRVLASAACPVLTLPFVRD